MKRKFSIRRAAALTMSLVLLLLCFWPSLTARASDLTIDTSGFSDIQVDHMNVYYWHKGLPPNNSDTCMKKYPILMTWKNQYYFQITPEFIQDCDNNANYDNNGRYDGWSSNDDYSGRMNGNFGADGNYPHGAYRQNMLYRTGLLANIENLDINALNTYGTAATITIPEGVPILIPLNYDDSTALEKRFALRFELPESMNLGTTAGNYHQNGGFRTGENYLGAIRYDYYRVKENLFGWDTMAINGFYWSLYGINSNTINMLLRNWNCTMLDLKPWGYSDRNSENKETAANAFINFDWEVRKVGEKYAFRCRGSRIRDGGSRVSHSFGDADELEWLIAKSPYIALGWNNNYLESRGNLRADYDWYDNILNGSEWFGATRDNMTFQCYYGEPVTMNKLNTSFSVENGQVSNFDIATYISEGTVITVKEGGTLSITGWMLNNGTIQVEEGGTLYVQDGACVNRYKDGKHTGGGIISHGLILVGENAKLIGGGIDGIQLLEGSHCVNYGCVASENFKITVDHSLENRGSGFALYGPGNGVNGSGATTYTVPLSGNTFSERGAVETNVADPNETIVPNAIYHN